MTITPLNYDCLPIYKGADWIEQIGFATVAEDGTQTDLILTGWFIEFKAKFPGADVLTLDLSTINGKITLSEDRTYFIMQISADDTANLSDGILEYDIFTNDPDWGTVKRMYGNIAIYEQVT